ncbi:MAG TPA: CZB domain-containing protein [Thiobacillaceae bacterium]
MDWMEIISAHVMWKQRLAAFLAGGGAETLDPDVIGQDSRCALGQWIHGEGRSMEDVPLFAEVRDLHAQFHRSAADVIILHLSGNTPEAENLLAGSYSRLSEKLKHRLLGLSRQVNSVSDGIPRF